MDCEKQQIAHALNITVAGIPCKTARNSQRALRFTNSPETAPPGGFRHGVSEPHASEGEFTKGLFDHLKHVATLATGSILTIVTLLQNVFKQPVQRILVPYAVTLFILSIAASLIAFGVLVLSYPRPRRLER